MELKELRAKILEALVSALPVTVIVYILALTPLFDFSGVELITFTIGAVLWRAGQHAHTRTPLRHFLPVALAKLLLHPALVLGGGLLARAAGIDLPLDGLLVLTLAAALPSASNVSLLAERYGADNGRVARIILASTVLAFGSFTLLAWLLGAGN